MAAARPPCHGGGYTGQVNNEAIDYLAAVLIAALVSAISGYNRRTSKAIRAWDEERSAALGVGSISPVRTVPNACCYPVADLFCGKALKRRYQRFVKARKRCTSGDDFPGLLDGAASAVPPSALRRLAWFLRGTAASSTLCTGPEAPDGPDQALDC